MASPVTVEKLKQIASGYTDVVDRGKGWLRSKKPGTNQYAISSIAGGLGYHFGTEPFTEDNEINTAWESAPPEVSPYIYQMVLADYNAFFGNGNLEFDAAYPFRYVNPYTEDFLNWQPMPNLQWSNDLNSVANIGIAKQNISAQINDDELYFPGVYGTGLDFYLQTQTTRLAKRFQIASLATIGTPPQFIIDGGNPVLILSFQFQRSSGVTIWADGVEWEEGNGQSNAIQSINSVEFRDSQNNVLWYLSPTRSWDSEDNLLISPIRFRLAGASYIIELRVPWEWLQTAIYPVYVDPTIDVDVVAGADDGYWTDNGGYDSTSNVTYVGNFDFDPQSLYSFFRFTGVTLSGTIDTAYITVWSNNSGSEPVRIRAIDQDNPTAITSNADGISRPQTTAYTDWTFAPTGGGNNQYQSPSIVGVCSELVASYTISNEAVEFVIGDNGASSFLGILVYEYSPSNATSFYAEYTEGGGGPNLPIFMHYYRQRRT